MLLLIDNYDSFTYNLFQYLAELGADVEVIRNDKATVEELADMEPERLVVSPGPSHPRNAGISIDAIKALRRKNPRIGRMPRPPSHRRSLRRHRRPRRRTKTRQNLDDRARRQRRLQKPPQPLRSRPLPLPSRPTKRRTAGLRSNRAVGGERSDYGDAASRDAVGGGAVSPGIDLDAAGEGSAAELFGDGGLSSDGSTLGKDAMTKLPNGCCA